MFNFLKKLFNFNVFNLGGGFLYGANVPTATDADYLESYSASNLIKGALGKISDKAATIELELYRARLGKASEVEQHELLDLLARPNPIMSGGELLSLTAIYEKTLGNAYWYKSRGANGKIIELWPMRSDLVSVETAKDGTIKWYRFRSKDGADIKFKPEEVIHFKTPNPLTMYQGIGDLKGLIEVVRGDIFAKKWNTKFFLNSARPDGFLSTDGKLNKNDKKDIKELWEKKYGGYENAHKTAVLANGLKWETLSQTHKDMDFPNLRVANRDDVLMTLGVPKSVMSITDDVNRANAETGVYVFLSLTIEPMFRRWVNKLNHSLVSDFDLGLYLDYQDPTPEDEESLDDHYSKALNQWMTINEVRDERGLEPVEGGDVIYQQLGQMPLGETFEPIDDDVKGVVKLKANKTKTKKERKLEGIYKKALRNNKWLRVQEDVFLSVVDSVTKEIKKSEKGFSEKEKKVLWKIFDVRLRKWEEYWEVLQESLFENQRKRIIKALKASDLGKSKSKEVDFINWDNEDEYFSKKANPVVIEVVKESGEYAMNLVGTFNFDESDKTTAKWIDKKVMQFATNVNTTTKKQLKESLAEGLADGEGVTGLAKRVNSVMKGRIESSAQTIARTEVLSASNAGTIFGYKQSEIVEKKEWLATRDGNTRSEHLAVDGKRVSIDKKFNVGGDWLLYPGDPQGSPSQIVNCRCTILPVIKG